MGWKWEDEPSNSFSSRRGFGEIGEFGNQNPRSEGDDQCSTRKIVKSSCRTEEVEPGRFLRRCEKTEQTLRHCVGRPVEVVESNTEHTEEDVTDEVKSGSPPFESPGIDPFTFPGLRSDIEVLERSVLGGFSHFLEAAEEMTNEFFRSFGKPSLYGTEPSSSPLSQGRPVDGQLEKDASKDESAYSEFAGQIRDV